MKIFRQKSIRFFAHSAKIIKRLHISPKNPKYLLLKTLNSVLISLQETFSKSPNAFFCSKSANGKNLYSLFPKKSVKIFLWTRRIQFSQACWRSFAKNLKCCGWKSVKDKKNYMYFFSKKSLNTFHGTRRMPFWQFWWSVLPRSRKIFWSGYEFE